MAATFKSTIQEFGTTGYPAGSTNCYTTPASKASVIVGISITNKSAFELPMDVWIQRDSTKHYLAKSVYVPAGKAVTLSNAERIVLQSDGTIHDVVNADAPTVDGSSTKTFSCLLSIYEDVN